MTYQIERRRLLRCLGLAPVVLTAACEVERRAGSKDSQPAADAEGPDGSAVADGGVESDAGIEDIGVEDAGHVHPEACAPTGADVEGPFHRTGAPARTVLVGPDEPGVRLAIDGNVLDPDCRTPIAGAVLDVWHADASGNYDNVSADYRLRGILSSDEQGAFAFETIRPGNYPDAGGMRPAHIHFTIIHPDYQPLTTQLYFAGDPFLAPNDSCAFCNSEDPTLILDLRTEQREGVEWLVGHFDVVLRAR